MYSLSTASLRESPAYINKGQGMNGIGAHTYPEELAAGEDLTQKEGEEQTNRAHFVQHQSLKLMELPCGHALKGAFGKLSSSRAIDSQTFTPQSPLASDEYCRYAETLQKLLTQTAS